jgi:hypothetical protein
MATRFITAACMVGLSVFGASAQSGSWKGELNVGGTTLPVVFNFSAEGCTLDSPAQGAKGIPAKWTPDASGKVSIQIPVINGSFEGKLTGDSIPGKFTQHGYSIPLTLRRGEVKLNRPQTPKPPYPYTTEEVSFKNGDAVLSGTLTLPENYTKNTPVLVMVTGSGLQNRDEEAFGHKPFAVIADALARQGIATLRYDDRGFGESTGDVIGSTIDDFKNDAAAGIGLLRTRFKHVGVLGHSEGGTIAMMLAADKTVDFAISLAGMTVTGKELLLRQNRDALAGIGLSSDIVDIYCRHLSDGMDAVIAGKDPEPVNDTQLPAALNQNLSKALQQFATPYMRSFIRLSAKDNLAKTSVPLLALNGTKDTQVDYVNNLAAVKTLASSKPFTVKSYEGLNHFFQHAETGSVDEYGKIEETISPEVLSDIIAWIKALKTK